MEIKLTGFKELINNLGTLKDVSNRSFDELFVPSFMKKYTCYETIDDFFKSGNFVINSQEDFDKIDTNELDKHTQTHTQFESWQKMLSIAGQEFMTKDIKS